MNNKKCELLREAFQLVQDNEDWKNPINKQVKLPDHISVEDVLEAISHYTATIGNCMPCGDEYIFIAEGYRMGPCGDH